MSRAGVDVATLKQGTRGRPHARWQLIKDLAGLSEPGGGLEAEPLRRSSGQCKCPAAAASPVYSGNGEEPVWLVPKERQRAFREKAEGLDGALTGTLEGFQQASPSWLTFWKDYCPRRWEQPSPGGGSWDPHPFPLYRLQLLLESRQQACRVAASTLWSARPKIFTSGILKKFADPCSRGPRRLGPKHRNQMTVTWTKARHQGGRQWLDHGRILEVAPKGSSDGLDME